MRLYVCWVGEKRLDLWYIIACVQNVPGRLASWAIKFERVYGAARNTLYKSEHNRSIL